MAVTMDQRINNKIIFYNISKILPKGKIVQNTKVEFEIKSSICKYYILSNYQPDTIL